MSQLASACASRPGSSAGRIASPARAWVNRSVRYLRAVFSQADIRSIQTPVGVIA